MSWGTWISCSLRLAGHPPAGEASAREALQTFRAAKMPELEIQAHAILAQTLLAQEKLSQARQEIAQGKPLAAKTQQRLVRLRFEIVAAQVLAASGKPSDLQAARSALDAMIRETEKIQLLSDLFEARFARGDIEMKYGNQADGRIRLAAVEKEAASSGFALITKKQINQKLSNHTRLGPSVISYLAGASSILRL